MCDFVGACECGADAPKPAEDQAATPPSSIHYADDNSDPFCEEVMEKAAFDRLGTDLAAVIRLGIVLLKIPGKNYAWSDVRGLAFL